MPDLSAPTKRDTEIISTRQRCCGCHQWPTLRETSSRCYSVLVNSCDGDLAWFSGFSQAPQSNVHMLRA